MNLQNTLTVPLLAALLAFTGLACGGGEDTADVEIDTPAEGLSPEGEADLETETETEMGSTETETEMDMEPTETETEMDMEPTPSETS